MVRKVRDLLMAIVVGIAASAAHAQDLPPNPVPVVPGTQPSSTPAPPRPPDNLPAPVLGGPPTTLLPPPPPGTVILPYQDRNGPLLRGDPLLDRPESPPPGWFLGLEFDLLGSHLKNRLQAPVTVDDFGTQTIHLPTAELDWTVSPRVELGYRFEQGLGEVLFSYRFLETEGHQDLPGFDLDGSDGFLRSRLSLNVIDLDYASREYSLGPCWDMKWKAGVRLANVFFDSQAVGFFQEQRTANHFFGAGPHVGLDLWRSLGYSGLALFGRIEGAVPVGQIRQSFEQVIAPDDNTLIGGATLVRHTQAVPTLELNFGLSWTQHWARCWSRYSLGYTFENWWYVGDAGDSRGELTAQGVFFRAEFAY
jgi:Legionella pneumophila major outer membrane protein precursor